MSVQQTVVLGNPVAQQERYSEESTKEIACGDGKLTLARLASTLSLPCYSWTHAFRITWTCTGLFFSQERGSPESSAGVVAGDEEPVVGGKCRGGWRSWIKWKFAESLPNAGIPKFDVRAPGPDDSQRPSIG